MTDPNASDPPQNTPPTPASTPAQAPVGMDATQSKTPSAVGRTILIHGYSATGGAFLPWSQLLESKGIVSTPIAVGNYITLNNEVTIKDLGEAFDRALRLTEWSSGTKDDTWTFDAIVHSTGMLVVRQWLTSDPFGPNDERSRVRRLKHLIGLAPATFGSPQAKKGRSWLGALVKGNRDPGPDFLNAGDLVLDGLELGSKYTWDLALKDMLGTKPLYDEGPNTPYVAVFIGDTPYSGVDAIANSPGTDGTVRWAGCALNSRMVSLDLRREPKLKDTAGNSTRCNISPWAIGRLAAPMIAVAEKNHGSMLSDPDEQVAQLIGEFFAVANSDSYNKWEEDAIAFGASSLKKMNAASKYGGILGFDTSGGAGWQQLIVHVVDDHGDGVLDYNLQLFIGDSLDQSDDPTFKPVLLIADTYSGDASYRCFYIRLSDDMLEINTDGANKKMWVELIASSGSTLVEYEAYTSSGAGAQSLTVDHLGGAPVKLDITALAQGEESLLYPYTTTLLEIFVEREPLPLDAVSPIFNFLQPL
jgi:hypothetical protein